MSDPAANLVVVRDYLAALAAGKSGAELARFFTPDAYQLEFPNQLNPRGGRSDLATLQKRAEQGKQVLKSQHYEIVSAVAQGNRVAVEAEWSGVLAIPVATLAPGDTMKANFAMFFEMADGRIRSQHNYDCFQPW